ncbi:hypothetical protein ACFE04_009658 [Oxalis oulophora]
MEMSEEQVEVLNNWAVDEVEEEEEQQQLSSRGGKLKRSENDAIVEADNDSDNDNDSGNGEDKEELEREMVDLDLPPTDNSSGQLSSSLKNFASTSQVNGASDLIQEIFQEITETDVEKTLQKENGKQQQDVAVEIIAETDEEIIDLNVKNVIAKQNAYDLVCPNCHACITRTVILRKRKPKVQYFRKKEKHAKVPTENIIEKPSPDISAPIYSNDSQPDDDRPDNQSIIFRCFSCFSIFIPAGSGFKEVKETNENENTQNPENKSWFYRFLSYKKKTTTTQVGGVVVDSVTETSSITQPLLEGSRYVEPVADGTLNILQKPAENVPITFSDIGEALCFSPSNEKSGEYNISTVVRNTKVIIQDGKTLTDTKVVSETKIDPVLDQTIGKNVDGKPDGCTVQINTGDVIVTVEPDSTSSQNIVPSPDEGNPPQNATIINIIQQPRDVIVTERYGIDILKSIVYGGLVESVTSFGVVASAAGAGASTVDVLAIGLANMIGGLFVILHHLRDLRMDRTRVATNAVNTQEDRYQELLGRRENLWLHATIVLISYIIFGLIPPVVYGYSSFKTDNREMKILALFVVSLVCVFLLAIGKAHTRPAPKTYIKTAFYYLSMAIVAAGVAYGSGDLIKKIIVKLHWLDYKVTTIVPFHETNSFERTWASY